MKTKLSKLMSGVIILLLTGCAGFNNSPYSNELVQTKLSLSQDNYRIVKQVEGEWSARYIFGIGGMKYKTVTTNALSEMYKNAHLVGNQQIINITTTTTVQSWIGIVIRRTVIARGYVIEFLPSKQDGTKGKESTTITDAQPATVPQNVSQCITDGLPHSFQVDPNGKKVYFSKGNLQYKASTSTWRFAENQYDMIGTDNAKISSSYSGWIDLFGWGTGNNPTLTSIDSKKYSAFTDWGVNSISNGDNHQWRTLTYAEWQYLLTKNIHTQASVCGVCGLLLLPIDCDLPTDLALDMNVKNYKKNRYNAKQWLQLEHVGAVFLPASSIRNRTVVNSLGHFGYYWSATPYNENYAWSLSFGSDGADMNSYTRDYGQAVRLVRDAE